MHEAYGYIRVSGSNQLNGDGPERQETAIRAYAQSHSIQLVRIFVECICGEVETLERPAFMDLMTAIDTGSVKTVIVERLDRLSRSLLTQETCIQSFTKQGISLLSCDPAEVDLMANDPSRILVRQVFGAIAQYDKAMLVCKLRAARQRMKASGKRMEGQRPFGSRQGEQSTVGLITGLREASHSYEAIANILNADGIPSRHGGKWHATTVKRILVNTNSVQSDKPTIQAALVV